MKICTLTLILAATFAVVPLRSVAEPSPTGPKNGTVLIIRHAEKPPDDDPSPLLIPTGSERAQKYIDYFKQLTIGGNPAVPSFVFVAKSTKKTERPWLTIEPLINALHLPFDNSTRDENFAQVVDILKSGKFDGKTVLVCWHHGNIPQLLDALGADHKMLLGKNKWPSQIFGWLVELQFDSSGVLKSSLVINEHLMDDDTQDPPTH